MSPLLYTKIPNSHELNFPKALASTKHLFMWKEFPAFEGLNPASRDDFTVGKLLQNVFLLRDGGREFWMSSQDILSSRVRITRSFPFRRVMDMGPDSLLGSASVERKKWWWISILFFERILIVSHSIKLRTRNHCRVLSSMIVRSFD